MKKKTLLSYLRNPWVWILILLIFLLPSFVRMIRPGIYSMQDFPYFRIVEYSKCIADMHVPCRWSPDAALGFGEPIFNFYAPLPFILGGILSLSGMGAVLALKTLFAGSLLGSGLAMFLLARKIWKNDWSAFLSAALYVYAPYRAVNVWVRGALPEACAFILFPLIVLCFENYVETKKKVPFLGFVLSLGLLVLTHNLSVVLFSLALAGWILFRLTQEKKLQLLPILVLAGVMSLLLTAFYWLPATVESSLVNLQTTTAGYFDFRAHFVTVPQIFFSRFWGYGGSTWGEGDGLSLAIGHLQWIAALFVCASALILYIKTKKLTTLATMALFLCAMGGIYLVLMHNKSAPIWEALSSVMQYIQFPWRFLGVALFLFALASGFLPTISSRYSMSIAAAGAIIALSLNTGFFKEDLWFMRSDMDMQTGTVWEEQKSASIGDYWPIYGPIPREFAISPDIVTSRIKSNSSEFTVITKDSKEIELPVAYFPDWRGTVNGLTVPLVAGKRGLIEVHIPKGESTVTLNFHNTPIRTIANGISLISVSLIALMGIKRKRFFYER